MWLAAVLHSIALLITLLVQTMDTPLAGAWLFPFLAGCLINLRKGFPVMTPVRWLCVAWLTILFSSCFILQPFSNGAATLWMLAAMPLLGLTVHEEDLGAYAKCFGVVISIFALNLIAQKVLDVHYTLYPGVDGARRKAWPLLDSNSAAAVVDFGLISLAWLRVPGVLVFAAALRTTLSRTGVISACCVGVMFIFRKMGWRYGIAAIGAAVIALVVYSSLYPVNSHEAIVSLSYRWDIWKASWRLLWERPWTGLGLGTFWFYYRQVRTEGMSAGVFAHNDILQLAIECGIPAALILVALLVTAFCYGLKYCPPAAGIILCITIMASVEFQFYVPPVSILMGLALAYCNPKRSRLYCR